MSMPKRLRDAVAQLEGAGQGKLKLRRAPGTVKLVARKPPPGLPFKPLQADGSILVECKTQSPNERELWQARAGRAQRQRTKVSNALMWATKPPVPCSILLTRIAPSGGLDDDNLAGSLKAVRDAVAEWIGVDDRHHRQVKYRYGQQRGEWGVLITFGEPVKGAQYTLDVADPDADAF